MIRRGNRWLLAAGAAVLAGAAALAVAGWWAARNFEPFLREQTVAYLERRFDADVQVDRLKVRLRWRSTWDMLVRRGKGAVAEVEAGRLALQFRREQGRPPLLAASGLKFTVDLGTLNAPTVVVREARVEGLVIQAPPRRGHKGTEPRPVGRAVTAANVVIQVLEAPDSRLVILPRDPSLAPLEFVMHRLTLRSAARGRAMRYETELTNAKPSGLIRCHGSFGPWEAESPSDTPVSGEYTFEKADLGVFRGIAGMLSSQGKFRGVLGEIAVDGTTRTPRPMSISTWLRI